jgi:dipeptidase
MNRDRSYVNILFLIAFSLTVSTITYSQTVYDQKLDCYSVVVGRKASADGSVIFAHNEDTGLGAVNYFKVPKADHRPDETILLENGGKLPQSEHTFAYLWINRPGCGVCDSYINEFGVSVGSDGCPSREENPEYTDGGIVFWLRRIVAERARTAREGVELAGKLITEFGYASSGRSYVIADPNEGWVLAVVNGKHWVAHKVPDNQIAIIANCYTMQDVDLKDTANFIGSPDIIDYAISQGWFNPSRDGKFNFSRSYSNPGSLIHPGNTGRMWRGAELVSGRKLDDKVEFPFTVTPLKKVAIQDIMGVLRDHYEGTKLDRSFQYTLGNPHQMNEATICADGTQYSFVAHLRNWLPVEIGPIVWIAPYRPDVQTYCPWYPSVSAIPASYSYRDGESALKTLYNPPVAGNNRNNGEAFRMFVSLFKKIDQDYGKLVVPVQNSWKPFEKKVLRKQDKFEKRLLKRYSNDSAKLIELITSHTSKIALEIASKTDQITKTL